MASRVTFGQLKDVLEGLGFRERRKTKGVAFEHRPSDTVFLFRPYKTKDRMQLGELTFVRTQLDARGLLKPESFETLLAKAPA